MERDTDALVKQIKSNPYAVSINTQPNTDHITPTPITTTST